MSLHVGFNLNSSSKLNHLELLYRVNSHNHHIEPHESINFNELNEAEDFDEFAGQILSVQFLQDLNILATGDSNGRVKVD